MNLTLAYWRPDPAAPPQLDQPRGRLGAGDVRR